MRSSSSPRIPVSKPCLGDTERALLLQCFDSGQLTLGPMVEEFERRFAHRVGAGFAVAVTSGTTALHLALAAAGIGPGDEVLVPDLTFVATANAVKYTGATPVLVDVDPFTWCIDVDAARRSLTPATRAIVPVHLYGRAADMGAIHALAVEFGLVVIEDAAEGLGGTYDGRPLGSLSNVGTFSFYGNKVMTTGEGGMVVTNSPTYRDALVHLRGQAVHPERRYYHSKIGFNYRMTDLQAAVGLGQLVHLDRILSVRRAIIDRYATRLRDLGPFPCAHREAAPWLFTFQAPVMVNRDNIARRLAADGVDTRPVFIPMHRLPMFWKDDGQFPNATLISSRGLSLPTYPELPLTEVDDICDLVLAGLSDLGVAQ